MAEEKDIAKSTLIQRRYQDSWNVRPTEATMAASLVRTITSIRTGDMRSYGSYSTSEIIALGNSQFDMRLIVDSVNWASSWGGIQQRAKVKRMRVLGKPGEWPVSLSGLAAGIYLAVEKDLTTIAEIKATVRDEAIMRVLETLARNAGPSWRSDAFRIETTRAVVNALDPVSPRASEDTRQAAERARKAIKAPAHKRVARSQATPVETNSAGHATLWEQVGVSKDNEPIVRSESGVIGRVVAL